MTSATDGNSAGPSKLSGVLKLVGALALGLLALLALLVVFAMFFRPPCSANSRPRFCSRPASSDSPARASLS